MVNNDLKSDITSSVEALSSSSSTSPFSSTQLQSSSTSTRLTNHLAFGGGPRMCPGRYLALRELKYSLTEILGKNGFTWVLEDNQNLNQIYTQIYTWVLEDNQNLNQWMD